MSTLGHQEVACVLSLLQQHYSEQARIGYEFGLLNSLLNHGLTQEFVLTTSYEFVRLVLVVGVVSVDAFVELAEGDEELEQKFAHVKWAEEFPRTLRVEFF